MKKFKVNILLQESTETNFSFVRRIQEFCNKIENLKREPKITLTSVNDGLKTALIQYIVLEAEEKADDIKILEESFKLNFYKKLNKKLLLISEKEMSENI